jgi:hypothetical protein
MAMVKAMENDSTKVWIDYSRFKELLDLENKYKELSISIDKEVDLKIKDKLDDLYKNARDIEQYRSESEVFELKAKLANTMKRIRYRFNSIHKELGILNKKVLFKNPKYKRYFKTMLSYYSTTKDLDDNDIKFIYDFEQNWMDRKRVMAMSVWNGYQGK